jgi:hypothetical protein
MATPAERYRALREAVDFLESAVDHLSDHLGRPDQVVGGKFRYAEQSAQILQLGKAVRIVSGLNACLVLLPPGYYAEILMLLRCVNDFLGEILYVHEALQTGTPTAEQQRFLEHFFEEHGDTAEAIIAKPPRGSVVERKKIHASHGRMMTPDNPHDTQKTWAAIDAVFGGYIHGSYSSVMELYEGGTWRFRMRGMAGTPRANQVERQVVLSVHRTFNALRGIGWSANDEWVFDSSRTGRLLFEQSAACEGMTLSVPTNSDDAPP